MLCIMLMLSMYCFFLPLQFLLQLADNSNQHLRNIALDALDQSICAVLGSEKFQDSASRQRGTSDEVRILTWFIDNITHILWKIETDCSISRLNLGKEI